MSYAFDASNADAVLAMAQILVAPNLIINEARADQVAIIKAKFLDAHGDLAALMALKTIAALWADLKQEVLIPHKESGA